ncbi:bacteriohemerythrin [Hydrogenoanaerobacterium sp.]|uniref:bacteriohemerythrin n=1 Tax=Hydrogenoanaerobacterium sp. TaxID=2953763 RepID=UPI00289736FE|nr:bacteriohemerythrin [Hydrogenoanaerobacterium sp.]
MAYAFTDDLRTGNATIDHQHEQLFLAINNLLDACSQGKGRAEMDKTVKFLYDYTIKHFSDEEKLQQHSQYPDYLNHKKYHESFTGVVREIMDELEQKGPSLTLVFKVNQSVGGWLINHIKIEDAKVAAHIRQHNG